ncbi:hypothetical protein F4560_002892 [Saccharothrix ecbatanensis]|uniref:Uncharacterized protein n=1 Tax=Saccharothrix ecbatanensis TaxID=1105145 RepID=A0A7W9HJS4_9PSEU|nr:hypothetical protein [Saccharothrix ecbatanensis]MBB5803124.1 hypothetical protein [Saccharothrix ecbatanensis]
MTRAIFDIPDHRGRRVLGAPIEPRPTERAVRRDWPQVITAMTALGGLIFTALSLRATREQIKVAEQGQISDRYAKPVELLGTPGPEHFQVRLGGIYALERLAADSPRDQYDATTVGAWW